GPAFATSTWAWWAVVGVSHLPYLLLLVFLGYGLVERIGYYRRGRTPHAAGRLPDALPRVCVQLPMFNEDTVFARSIAAAAELDWPEDRLVIQVLDDSTDPSTRDRVRAHCVMTNRQRGVSCRWIHRTDRTGYKAGALEAGRGQSDADFILILDADFVPPPDLLKRIIPHFYDDCARPLVDLALVQAQWVI
ncbi:MAG: glycosyltransferase, partial [Gammaproteobacteria bacterium]|nr:glycosyltransferase [Gammaproteobacteria bacterium]